MPAGLQILHHDADVMVVNKPSGLSVHRGWDPDPVNALTIARGLAGKHVHPVHRLDRATSGCLVFALSRDLVAPLQQSLQASTSEKRYVALVRGLLPAHGRIDHPVPNQRGRRVPAVTDYWRLASFERYSLVVAIPRTGRLHQIRRHFKHLSHPLIGDVRYGKGEHNRAFRSRFELHRLGLHALRIRFGIPGLDRVLDVRADLPPDLAVPLRAMGFDLDALIDQAAHGAMPLTQASEAAERGIVAPGHDPG